jgi:ElaB/YqjD/DUF883 family membrane-anchored ribosome-binding protein
MSTILPVSGHDPLPESMDAIVGQTEQLLRTVALTGKGQAAAMRADIDQRLARASERFTALRTQAVDGACAAARNTDAYVHGNPWRAVAITAGTAALAGLVIGMLASRREP